MCYEANIVLLPSRKGFEVCVGQFQFEYLSRLGSIQGRLCFTTPDLFFTGSNFPLRGSWSNM